MKFGKIWMNFGLNSVNFQNLKHKIRFGPRRNRRISLKFRLSRSNPEPRYLGPVHAWYRCILVPAQKTKQLRRGHVSPSYRVSHVWTCAMVWHRIFFSIVAGVLQTRHAWWACLSRRTLHGRRQQRHSHLPLDAIRQRWSRVSPWNRYRLLLYIVWVYTQLSQPFLILNFDGVYVTVLVMTGAHYSMRRPISG
jgi:hypothetical protein